jgi:hypothetical protein
LKNLKIQINAGDIRNLCNVINRCYNWKTKTLKLVVCYKKKRKKKKAKLYTQVIN